MRDAVAGALIAVLVASCQTEDTPGDWVVGTFSTVRMPVTGSLPWEKYEFHEDGTGLWVTSNCMPQPGTQPFVWEPIDADTVRVEPADQDAGNPEPAFFHEARGCGPDGLPEYRYENLDFMGEPSGERTLYRSDPCFEGTDQTCDPLLDPECGAPTCNIVWCDAPPETCG